MSVCKYIENGFCTFLRASVEIERCKDCDNYLGIDGYEPRFKPNKTLESGCNALMAAVVMQAVEDYKKHKRRLLQRNISPSRKEYSEAMVKSCEKFFNSEWCCDLLEYLNINLTSKYIINKLQEDISND